MMREASSLRRGLLTRLGLLMLGFSVLAPIIVYQIALRLGDEAYDEWLLDSARSLALLLVVKDDRVTIDLPGASLDAFVFDAHDRVLFRVDDQHDGFVAGQPVLHAQPRWDAEVRYMNLNVDGQPMRAVQMLRHDVRPDSAVSIIVAETQHKRDRLASRVLWAVMVLGLGLSALTMLLVRDAVTRGLRPVRQLADIVRQRPDGDLTRLPDAHVAQELRTFTNAINELLSRLDQAVQLQRRFIADAAHQLRTPLAALSVELEYAIREPDPARKAEGLAQLRGGIDRLSRLSNQLLTLARAEPGALASSTFRELDLHDLVHRAATQQLPRFMDAGVDLGFEGLAHPMVRGDALLLEEVVNNLLDNALRYAGAGAEVTVSVACDGPMAEITVEDTGPGVPPEELGRLTERFHRAPGSAPGGAGLGLAIIKEIAHLHEGTLDFSLVSPHGLRVRVSLPIIAAAGLAAQKTQNTQNPQKIADQNRK